MTDLSFRRSLEHWEVPLPPEGGFTHDLLDLDYKAELRAEHEDRIRTTKEDRLRMYRTCETDLGYRKMVYEMCRRDPEFFIDHFVWTYDDREGEIKPMVLWTFQREKVVRPYVEMCNTLAPARYTGMMAKSRALGWSWVSMSLRACSFLFRDNWSILIGGQQRDDVDDGGIGGTHQSLFGKLRFILEHLPGWMKKDLLGDAFYKDSASNSFNKTMKLKNPMKPLNMIQGKQLGGMFGRGPRFSEVFGDEVAWAEEMQDADTALKQTTNRFFGGSTPKGMTNFFAQMMFGELRIHRYWCWWAEHPFLGLDWYNAQRQEMTDSQIAQELDISFERSLGGTVIQNIPIDDFFRPVEWDEHLGTQVWIDPGFADHMALLFVQWDPFREEGRIVDQVITRRHRIDWCVPFILGFIPEMDSAGKPWPHHYNEVELQLIERHANWIETTGQPFEALGDFAGGAKTANTGTSCWDELESYGIYVEGVKMPQNEIALEHMNLVLRHVVACDYLREQRNGPKEESPTLLEVFTGWRYRVTREGTQNTKPVHDRFCHLGDCIKMWCWDHVVPAPKNMDVRLKRTVEADPRRRKRKPYTNPFRSS
jgi:hypothetical protein